MSNTQNQDELEQILRDFADIGGHQDINRAKAAIQRLYKPIGEIEARIDDPSLDTWKPDKEQSNA